MEASVDFEAMKGYLFQRFIKNNHPRYHRYVNEWINNVTDVQLAYFKQEKERLAL